MNKVVLLFCVALLGSTVFAQDGLSAKKNLPAGPQQMVSAKRNYTSFVAPTKKEVTAELEMKTDTRFKNHPEFGILPYNVQCEDCYEMLEERTATTRYYLKNGTNGTMFYKQAGANDINYKDAAGNWRAIDPRIFPSEKNSHIYEAISQPSPTRIDLNKKQVSVFNGSAELFFNRNLKLYHRSGDQKDLIASADWSNATVGNDGIYVKNIFPGIDMEVWAIKGALKTSYIVHNKPSFTDGVLLIEDNMKLPYGTSFSTATASKNENGYQGLITINADQSNTPLYEIGEAVGYDLSDRRINPAEKFSYSFEGGNLSIVMPLTWFNKQGMIYPLTIDPLVTSTGTLLQGSILGSGGNGSGTFNAATACPYNLTVATPANCTISDIRFAFDYIAQNGAVKSEGATDFLYGACRSPGAGFIYYCNVGTAGPCTTGVAGISVYSDFLPCIPAPQCAPYNMTFTMRFYDRWGAACSNFYIGANSNWVMTIQGQTVAFANPGAPITLSANPICFGQTISASAAPSNGVPAYTCNWSFNSSGTPSVGTGTTSTISFPSAGTYTLYATVTDACAQSVSGNTVVTVNPLPTLSVTAATNPICLGQSTTLNASGANTYVWSANAGGGAGSSAIVTPPLGTTVYTVTGTIASTGCSNTGTVSVTVNPIPTVSASASPASVCAGQTAIVTASGATNYTWSANAGSVTTGTASVNPNTTDTYTVTGDALGCTSTGIVTVTVTPSPTLAVTATPATICAGQTATISVSGATSYTWSANAGSVNTSTASVTPGSTTTYTVTGDNSSCTTTETVTVNVNPLPAITFTASPSIICAGQTSTLTASGATTYTWSANSGGGNANPITVSPGATTSYTVSGTLAGCSDSTVVSVTVAAQPTVSAVASNTTICSSQSTTLTASGATNYTWSANAGSATTVTVSVSPNTTATYTVIGSNGGCSDSTTITVNVNALPNVTAVFSPSVICAGQNDTLTASGATTYTWSANAASAITNTVIVTPASTSTYVVIGTDANGCMNATVITVTVNQLPVVTVNSGTICAGQQTATLTAGGASTYTWSTTQTAVTITVSPTSNTNYTVVGTDVNGCMNFATTSVTVNQPPTVTVNSAAICSGSSATLTATGGIAYSWAPASTLSSGIGNPVTATPVATTTYTVLGIDVNGCFGTATSIVTVNPLPTITIASSPTAICTGSTATLSAVTSPTNCAVTWPQLSSSANTVTVSPGSTTVYTVIATDANNCVSSQVVSVTVNQPPSLSAVASQTNCAGINVNAINFGAGAGVTVNWTNTNANIGIAPSGTGNISSYTAPNSGSQQTGVVTATPVDGNTSCVGTSQTFTIVINPSPTVTNGIADTAFCGLPGGGVHGISAAGGTPALTYQWYSSGIAIPSATTTTLTGVGAGTYSFVVTDSKGCKAGSGPYTVIATPAVIAAFTPSPTNGTAPLNVSFTNQSVGANTYTWNFGNGSGSSATNPGTTYPNGGTYVVVLVATGANGCTSRDTATIFVDQPISIIVPNIFTPNGDGINEEFGIIASGITTMHCDIMNRWGQRIKTLSSPTEKWDGKLDNGNSASEGTYFYVLTASSYDNKSHDAHGSITLVR